MLGRVATLGLFSNVFLSYSKPLGGGLLIGSSLRGERAYSYRLGDLERSMRAGRGGIWGASRPDVALVAGGAWFVDLAGRCGIVGGADIVGSDWYCKTK